MSSGRWSITPTEFKRAIRCAEEAGLVVRHIEVDYKAGKISLAVGKPDEGAATNEWDAP